MEHNRFVIETMSFCQGNCSGCFFSEKERVGGSFMSSQSLTKVVGFVKERIKGMSDVSINFGQGDHLAVSDSEWNDLMFHVKQFKDFNPLITITTSAIEHFDVVKRRVDELHSLAMDNEMKIFFAVVLDPKKLQHKGFQERYVKNINYIRNKFGFIDLTINVGKDTLEHFSPEKLKEFLMEHKFRHLELNLIPTVNTVLNFTSHYPAIIEWFTKFRKISVGQPYLVFHHYHFNQTHLTTKNLTLPKMREKLQDWLKNNFYIDYDLKVSSIFSGFTGNAIPISEKTGFSVPQYLESFNELDFEKEQAQIAGKLMKHIIQDENCISCEFNKECLMSGSMIFKNQPFSMLHQKDGCFLGVKALWKECLNAEDKITGVAAQLIPRGLEQKNSFGVDEVA